MFSFGFYENFQNNFFAEWEMNVQFLFRIYLYLV